MALTRTLNTYNKECAVDGMAGDSKDMLAAVIAIC